MELRKNAVFCLDFGVFIYKLAKFLFCFFRFCLCILSVFSLDFYFLYIDMNISHIFF